MGMVSAPFLQISQDLIDDIMNETSSQASSVYAIGASYRLAESPSLSNERSAFAKFSARLDLELLSHGSSAGHGIVPCVEVVHYQRRLCDQQVYRRYGEHHRDPVLLGVFAELGEVEPLHPVTRPPEIAFVHEIALDAGDVGHWEMSYIDVYPELARLQKAEAYSCHLFVH